MKISLLLAVMLACPTFSSFAGEYSRAAALESLCGNDGAGALSLYSYYARETNDTKDKAEKFAERYYSDIEPGHERDVYKEIADFAVNYGFYKASSDQDAYMQAWAHCMDALR